MAQKVRILRNPVPMRSALFRVMRLIEVTLGVYNKHTRAATRDYMIEIRAAKIRKDTELAEMRRQKLSNDLVIGDLEIERRKMALGYRIVREQQPMQEGQTERAKWD